MTRTSLGALVILAMAVTPAKAQTPEQTAAWQREVDEAKTQRSEGRKTAWIGLGAYVVGTGVALSCFDISNSDCGGAKEGLATGVLLSGAVLIGVGAGSAHEAGQQLKLLTAHGAKPIDAAVWRHEFDAAGHKRSTGRIIGIIGLGIASAGIAVAAHSDCEGFVCPESSSRWSGFLVLGGAITSVAGFGRADDARMERTWLVSHQPLAATMPASTNQRGGSGVSVSLGPRSSVSYRIAW